MPGTSTTRRPPGSIGWRRSSRGSRARATSPHCPGSGPETPRGAAESSRPCGSMRATFSRGDHMAEIQFQVYGINLLVRLLADAPADVRVHCPKGSTIRYGGGGGRGDGFDEGANAFREMPPVRAVVAFEENAEEVEGHYFYITGEEHRVIRLDAVILSFPLE